MAFAEDARELAVVDQDVVRPLDPRLAQKQQAGCCGGGEPDDERQGGDFLGLDALHVEHDGQHQVLAGRRNPGVVEASASGRLFVGREHVAGLAVARVEVRRFRDGLVVNRPVIDLGCH